VSSDGEDVFVDVMLPDPPFTSAAWPCTWHPASFHLIWRWTEYRSAVAMDLVCTRAGAICHNRSTAAAADRPLL